MKLTIFALLSAMALALTTNDPSQDNTSISNDSYIPDGFPKNLEELGKMVDNFGAELNEVNANGINVEKWFFVRQKLHTLETAARWVYPKLTSHEQWHIVHQIEQYQQDSVPRRDSQAAYACSNGNKSPYCAFFRSAE